MQSHNDSLMLHLGRSRSGIIGNYILRLPIISRVYLEHCAIFADQDGLQTVNDLPIFLIVGEPEEVSGGSNLLGRA